MSNVLYELQTRRLGRSTTCVSVMCSRHGISVPGSEKVLPATIAYDLSGAYKIYTPRELLSAIKLHPYFAGGGDFTEERLADLEVSEIYKQLEHYPTMPMVRQGQTEYPHPVAQFIYEHTAFLQIGTEAQRQIALLPFEHRGPIQAEGLQRLAERLKSDLGVVLDLYSLPKRDVGAQCFIGDPDGFTPIAKFLGFGFHQAIPRDRIAREANSLKACEAFKRPEAPPVGLPSGVWPYVTMLTVAVIGTQTSMADSCDLSASGAAKLACDLVRYKAIGDYESVPEPERNLQYVSSRSGVDVVHMAEHRHEEGPRQPTTIRLVFPGGVKVAAQLSSQQATLAKGQPVDVLLDSRTLVDKGAIALLAMMDPTAWGRGLGLQECIQLVQGMKLQDVFVGATKYSGWVGKVPVMRPGQRYTDLAKPTNNVSVDLVARATLRLPYRVGKRVERDYAELRGLREAVAAEADLQEGPDLDPDIYQTS